MSTLHRMGEADAGLSKRQLGAVMALGGVLGFLAILSVDILDVGREGGIGPAQTFALLVAAAVILIGLSLLPLGDAPA